MRNLGLFLDGPMSGLRFRSATTEGRTDTHGRFTYADGEQVTFSIGTLVIGTVTGREEITTADFVDASNATALTHPGITNRARFLQSFATDPDLRDGVMFDEAVERSVECLDSPINFDVEERAFENDANVAAVLVAAGRRLRSAASARNHVRRALAGIRKWRDVSIPLRDGGHLVADVFVPASGGPHPVIMRLGVYGNAFQNGSVCNDESRARSDDREDRWFEEGRPDLAPTFRYSESMVSANASFWVPKGYALVRVDARGVGRSPGVLEPFSAQEARDYYDAIEWAAAQPWSDGNVGLFGSSYAATIQWNVAALAPPSLRAIVPFAGDDDAYRDLAYPGGIFNESYRQSWWDGVVRGAQCGQDAVDLIGGMRDHPFDDADFHGVAGQGPLSAEFEKITVPVLTAVSQTAGLHGRSGFEAFRRLPGHRQLVVVDASYFSFMYQDCVPDQLAFFDRFLKGVEPDVEPPIVRMVMRTGAGAFEWRNERNWPVPGTTYRALHLDATPISVGGRLACLLDESAVSDGVLEYSADADAHDSDVTSLGVSFITTPLSDDVELAGHFSASLWVSASASDMDVFVALRVIDTEDGEVPYSLRWRGSQAPITWGCLKVSHRKTDPVRSTAERPWHTHRSEDLQLLRPDHDIVPIEVELLPATARVLAGHRIRLDITPIEGPGARLDEKGRPTRRAYDSRYHAGAVNRVHTGPRHPSSIRLPIVPASAGTPCR